MLPTDYLQRPGLSETEVVATLVLWLLKLIPELLTVFDP